MKLCSFCVVFSKNSADLHLAISYDIYLPGGGGQATQTVGGLVLYRCGLRMCPLADADLQNF